MRIQQRDLLVIQYLSKFKQLTSNHIRSLVFPHTASTNPLYRTLNRLAADHYLARLERRLIGGDRGGGSQAVWQLGPEGWKLTGQDGRYQPARAIRPHTLAIADVYVSLVELERAGRLKVLGYSTEPDCHLDITGNGTTYYLRPDLFVDLVRLDGTHMPRFIEVDMASQGQRQITEKLSRYWHAYEVADAKQWEAATLVWFIAVDDARAEELRWLLSRGDAEQRSLFRVMTREEMVGALSQ